ncbi:MAG: hypothetical protein V3W34_06810 [Phycisphaerae bacterium]
MCFARCCKRLGVIGVVVVLAGCAADLEDSRHVRLMRGRPFEPDIPVPAGFVLLEKASEDRATGTSRLYLRHLYEGEGDKYATRNFYREQMPLARWTKVSDGNVKGFFTMRFEKANESCTVTITDEKKIFSTRTQIQIVVAREERGQKPPAPRTSP